MERRGERDDYQQLSLNGWETERQEEVMFEYCIIEALPVYKKQGTGYIWECEVYCPPDIFHQERNAYYHVQTKASAKEANKKRLLPGDVVWLKGTPYTQEVEMVGGGKKTINQVSASRVEVVRRAKEPLKNNFRSCRKTGQEVK